MSERARKISTLIVPSPFAKVWYMVPIASLLYEKTLLILFEWEREGVRRFSLNVRDASDSVELAREIFPPILLESTFVINSLDECQQEKLEEDAKQVKVICDVLADCGIKEAFETASVRFPDSLMKLMNQADAELESDVLAEFMPILPRQEKQVRIKSRL